MVRAIRSLGRAALRKFGFELLRSEAAASLQKGRRVADAIPFVLSRPEAHSHRLLGLVDKSRSQLRQDLFVLSETDFRRDGFFVEFGALDGVRLSNTYLLEKAFSRRGVLAEPALCWRDALKHNRDASIETRCVWRESNVELEFCETTGAGLSTLAQFAHNDARHRSMRGRAYRVETISLLDMLSQFQAPEHIDYLSIDTEGSEFEILSAFDFSRYTFDVITCEHNFSANRQAVHELLSRHGYRRTMEAHSRWDDWYVRQ
jgi:FkbM family methyltransferase